MENLVIFGEITTTSNKQSKEFKVENPQKTAYLKVDEQSVKKLQDFGLQMYTSDKDKVDFFCVKIVEQLKLYYDDTNNATIMDSSVHAKNFKTPEGSLIQMNIIKGLKAGNIFYRLQAVKLPSPDYIEVIEAENPFA